MQALEKEREQIAEKGFNDRLKELLFLHNWRKETREEIEAIEIKIKCEESKWKRQKLIAELQRLKERFERIDRRFKEL